ncbi:hypothetical protein NA56DRAFT_293823 [Hyaloscypha hepaticicola]|uniref:Uncharacterized protein n=1 Tax=Hyaloscypha hepaticicola TaxID=2082293 RepID=A0A2J6QK75_9HELO|nr:hypothetical protein NA56DRAFT_293823 [Hyaloscypha hepaticicola]
MRPGSHTMHESCRYDALDHRGVLQSSVQNALKRWVSNMTYNARKNGFARTGCSGAALGASQTAHKGSRCGDGCVDEDRGLSRQRRQRDVVKPLHQSISGFYGWC